MKKNGKEVNINKTAYYTCTQRSLAKPISETEFECFDCGRPIDWISDILKELSTCIETDIGTSYMLYGTRFHEASLLIQEELTKMMIVPMEFTSLFQNKRHWIGKMLSSQGIN